MFGESWQTLSAGAEDKNVDLNKNRQVVWQIFEPSEKRRNVLFTSPESLFNLKSVYTIQFFFSLFISSTKWAQKQKNLKATVHFHVPFKQQRWKTKSGLAWFPKTTKCRAKSEKNYENISFSTQRCYIRERQMYFSFTTESPKNFIVNGYMFTHNYLSSLFYQVPARVWARRGEVKSHFSMTEQT